MMPLACCVTGTTACPPGRGVEAGTAEAACCWACTAAALAAATAAIAAEVTEDELATGDAPVVAQAGDGFVSGENVVINTEGSTRGLAVL